MEALLLRFLTTFGAALIVVPLVRAFARSLGVVAQGEDGITSRPVVALFGGAALGVIVFGQAVVLGAHAELAVVLGAGAVVLFVGVIDEVVGLQPLTRLGVLLAVALACLFFRCRLGWTTSLTVDSMLTVVWVVGITRTYDRLDARDGLCAGVAIIVLVGLLCVAAFVDPAVVGAGASHYVMVLVGALSAFLVFNSSPASIYLGSGGSLFVGMNIAVLTLVPGSSLTGEVATGGPRPSTIIAILAPLAVLFVPLIDTSLETVLRVRAGRASAADGGRSLAARLLALRWSERTAVAVLWILAAAVTLLGIALSPGAWRLTRGAYLGGAALLTLGVALTRVGAVPTGRVGHGRRRVAPLVVDPSYPFRATEVIFHLGLVLAAYYGAYRVRFPDPPDFANNFYYFVKSLPITLAVQMTALFAVGAYRSNRTALGIAGAGVFARGVFLGAIGIQLVLLYAYRFESYPRAAFVTYAVLLFLLLTGSRVSFRLVNRWIGRNATSADRSGRKRAKGTLPAPRRVARVITRLNIGGPAIQAVSLSRHLQDFGFRTLLLYGTLAPGEGDMRYLLTPDVETEMVSMLGRSVAPWRDLRASWHVYRALCAFRPEVVHTHTAKAGAVGRIAALGYNLTVGRGRPARIVHTYHGHVFEGYFGSASTSVFVGLERWLARHTDVLVAISPRVRADLLAYGIAQPSQVRLIPLGFDLAPFEAIDGPARVRARLVLDLQADQAVVTTVGRLTDIKQHDLFLEMAAGVCRVRNDVQFLIAGDGELRDRLETLAEDLGIAERVRFLGWRTDLTSIYAATDVFVLTSRNEGTPVALIEAMAAGVPGVSTDVGGVGDVITNSQVGTLVAFGDAQALTRAVLELLGSPAGARDMGARAREVVLQRFHRERLLSDVAGLYDDLLSRANPSSRPQRAL